MPPAFEPLHSHVFDLHNPTAARRTRQVMWLTATMMVIEILAGTVFGSMALLADGWHMSSHALALGVAAGAYALARRHQHDPRFAFGTWKIEVLGGYTSAVLLMAVAAYMGFESVVRLVNPTEIQFDQAILVAVIGLAVNVVSAWALSTGEDHGHDHGHSHGHGHGHAHGHAHEHDHGHAHEHGHGHGHGHAHDHDHHQARGAGDAHGQQSRRRHHDLNLRAAYLHVVADAVTSVLAIVALLSGKYFGATWMDPAMGLVGTVLVARWAWGLLRDSGRVLLDAEMDAPVVEEVREVVHQLDPAAVLRDLHVWRVGKGKYACILSLKATRALDAEDVRRALAIHEELVHVTVEFAPA